MNYVFFHYPCNDGLMAAVAAYQALGTTAIYYGVDYNVEEKVVKQAICGNNFDETETSVLVTDKFRKIYFVDYCPSVSMLKWFYENDLLSNVVVIDHHATGFEHISDFFIEMVKAGKFSEHDAVPFDTYMSYDKSGALLTYDYFVNENMIVNEDIRKYFYWASIRDLFLDTADGISYEDKVVSNAFTSYVVDLRNKFVQNKQERLTQDEFCLALIQYVDSEIKNSTDETLLPYVEKVKDYENMCRMINKTAFYPQHNPEYVFVNCMHSHASTACYFLYMESDRPYAIAYQVGYRNGVYGLTLNFRCRKQNSIVELAKKYGGGGHKCAAGAFIPADREDFLDVVKEVLEGTMRMT